MNAKGYFEELTPKSTTESDALREWFNNAEVTTEPARADFFKYEVSIGTYNGTWYLFAMSPQKKAMGRRTLPDCYAKGTNKDDLRGGLERFITKMEAKIENRNAKTNAKREARATFENPYKVGDFLYSSWGYEQTNREFYQVIEVGKNSLKIREVAQNRARDPTARRIYHELHPRTLAHKPHKRQPHKVPHLCKPAGLVSYLQRRRRYAHRDKRSQHPPNCSIPRTSGRAGMPSLHR